MRADRAEQHDRPQALHEPPPSFFGLNLPGSGSFHLVRFLWWLPLLASLAGMVVLRSINPVWVHHSPLLLLLLSFVFLTVVSMLVALVAGRAFLLSGSPWLLLLGSGAVVWGSSAVLAAGLAGGDANSRSIVFNLSVWIAGFCHLLCTLALLRRWRAVKRPALSLGISYVGFLLVTAGVARAASASVAIALFAQNSGGGMVRDVLLASSIAMFAGSALLLRRRNRGNTSAFLEWYWMAMLLVAAGLLGIFLQTQFDSALTWLARATLYAGGAYMLTAVVLSMRESGGLSLEAELLEARRQYDDLFALAADGIILHLAEEGRIVRANPAVCSMLGYEAAELADLRFIDLVAPREQEAAAVALAATEPGGTLWHERTLAAKDGRQIRAEINSRFFHYGRLMVLSTIRDITERTRLQEAMRQRAEEIQTVMDVAPVAIFVAQDPDCDVIVGNRAANQLYEAGSGENVSSNATDARRVFQGGRELRPSELPMQRAALTNSEVRGAEVEILLPSGRRLTLIGSGMPLRDAAGGVRGCVGAFLDITDRQSVERALRERERRLQLAVGGAKLGVFEWDVRTDTWVWENEEMYQIFGRTDAEGPLNKEGILQTVVGEDVPGFLRALKKVTSPDRKFHATCRIVRNNDQAVRWVEFLGDFEFDVENMPVRLVGVVRDVTERRQSEEDVRKSREWLRVTLRSIGDGVIATDMEGKIVFLNPVAAKVTGWSIEEALGHPLADVFRVIGEAAGEPAEDVIGRVMRERGVVELSNHLALLTRDGREIPIEDSAAPILERDGTIAGVVVVFHDVAEQRLAQRALEESEQRLRAVGDNLPEAAVYRYSRRPGRGRGAMEFISAGYERLTGAPVAEALRRPASFFELMPLEDARRLRDANTAAVVRLTPFETEVRLKHRITGETRWMLVRAVGSRREDGSTVLDGVMLDITERKQAEEHVRRSNAILDARNRMLRSAITCEDEKELGRACVALGEEITLSEFGLVAEIGDDGGPDNLVVSAAGQRAYEAAGIAESSISIKFSQVSLCMAALRDGCAHFCNDPEVVCEQVLIPEGHPRIQSLLCVPLLHEGRAFGLLAMANRRGGYSEHEQRALEDLALGFVQAVMRMRAEKAARAVEERLRDAQKMESIGLLAGGIAHDFNNLLVGIVGNASLAEDMLPYGSPASQALRRIVSAGEQAAHLTRQMLAYAGKGRFIIGAVDISKIVTDSNALIQSSISKKISIRVNLDASAHPVESDPSQMQQVYMNLALNAAEAIGADIGVISVSTRVELIGEPEIQRGLAQWPIEPGLFTCLEVCDTGCGMPPGTRARIFEPFFTTKFQGRGLGLAAVAGIVRAHKGAIQVISAPGEGSVFRVYLPAVNKPAEPLDSPIEAEQVASSGGEILVVDDEESVCDLVTVALDRMGYHVHAARGGAEAIKIMAERGGEVDLVLLDMSMPGMNGQETLERLRAVRPDVRVVVSSGYSESETLRAFGGSRLSGFVQKPYTVHQLEEQIRAALARPSSV